MKDFFKKIWLKMKPHLQKFWEKLERFWKNNHITKWLVLTLLVIAIFTTGYLYIGAKRTNVNSLKSNLEQTTVVYDTEGTVAGSLYSQKGTFTSLENISPDLQQAVVSTEDKRFYDHVGFDPIGITRAFAGLIINRDIVGGGSTLTQQLAKNAYLTADQTFSRKLKELFLAIEIEKVYTKAEILEMYLNNAYFGNGVWGVNDASQKYFGKAAGEVNLAEAATLAGMLQSPSTVNPYDNYEGAINRRDTIIYLMLDQGVIGQEEANQAAGQGLNLVDNYVADDDYTYPYYFDAIIEEAVVKYDIPEEDLLNNGYEIYTALNQDHQQQLDIVYENDQLFPTSSSGEPVESASVVMNPQTGGVTGLIGGRGEHTFRGYNRATQMRRQPGSLLKPLSVYTPALEAGYDIDAQLVDAPIEYGEENYIPYNVTEAFSEDGQMPMYQAVAESANAPAVWLLNEIGLSRGIRKLDQFGIPVHEDDHNLAAVALGGMNYGTTLMEISEAYTAFSNGGVRVEPHLIQLIVNSQGEIVVDNRSPKTKRVTSSEVADQMTSMLLAVFSPMGTASDYKPEGYEIAGKTGTSDGRFGSGYATDNWLVAYTPDVLVTGWIGFDQPSEDQSITLNHSAGRIVSHELTRILPYTEITSFTTPSAAELVDQEEEGTWGEIAERLSGIAETFGETFDNLSERMRNYLNSQ